MGTPRRASSADDRGSRRVGAKPAAENSAEPAAHRGSPAAQRRGKRAAASRGLRSAVETGQRVFLRHPAADDVDEFQALRLASRRFLAPWEATPPDGSDSFTPAYFERVLNTSNSDLNQRFLVCSVESGEIMGAMSVGNIVRGSFQSCYVGYWIGQRYAGHGYMTEALALALRHAFAALKLHRVEANIVPENVASKALVRKLGFRQEGLALRYLRINGRWRDHEHWAMTIEDWQRLSPAILKHIEITPVKPAARARGAVRSRE